MLIFRGFLVTIITVVFFSGTAVGQNPEKNGGATSITITEAVVCEDIQNRAPVGSNDVFPQGVTKLYCFTRVVGAMANTTLTHNWYHNGNLKASVQLSIASADYRTWSSKTLASQSSGEWLVEILSEDGKPLQNLLFYIQ